jgi:integrase
MGADYLQAFQLEEERARLRGEWHEERERLRYGEEWDKHIPYILALEGKSAKPGRYHAPTPNLYLLVTAKQRRRWIFRYSRVDKTGVTEISLGPYPQIDQPKAIAKAEELRKLIADGIDPQADKSRRRGEKVTFAEAADDWIELQKGAWSESSMRNARILLHHHGKPLARKPIGRINKDMVQAALKPLWADDHAPQARRALAMWARVFDYAKVKDLFVGDNPARWQLQKHLSPKQSPGERPHLPALSYAELPGFIHQLRPRQGRATGAVALEFAILTACRTSEVLNMEWKEIAPDGQTWIISASRMKARRDHRVPLSDRAVEILARQKEQSNGSEFVFTGYTTNALASKTMILLLRNMGVSDTVHGFRSSFSDWAHDQKLWASETIEACLAHQVGTKVARAYRRDDDLENRRPVMAAWAAYCGSSTLA